MINKCEPYEKEKKITLNDIINLDNKIFIIVLKSSFGIRKIIVNNFFLLTEVICKQDRVKMNEKYFYLLNTIYLSQCIKKKKHPRIK